MSENEDIKRHVLFSLTDEELEKELQRREKTKRFYVVLDKDGPSYIMDRLTEETSDSVSLYVCGGNDKYWESLLKVLNDNQNLIIKNFFEY